MTDWNAVERQRWGGPSPWAGKDSRTEVQKWNPGTAEERRLRQILWDIYAAAGADTDGERTAPPPGVMTPDVPELALEAVRELRADYDEDLKAAYG